MAAAVFFSASGFSATVAGLADYSPGPLALLRLLVASLLLALYAALSRMRLPKVKDLPALALAGLLGFSVFTVFLAYGQLSVPVGTSTYRTESQLKRILDQLITQLGVGGEAGPAQADIGPLIAMGEEVLAGGDPARAASIFRQVRDMAPDDAAAIGGLVRALIAGGEADEARKILDGLSPELAGQAPVTRARAALETAGAGSAGEAAELEKKVAANPDDLEARYDLAGARMAAGDRDRAADELLAIVERDKDWNEGAARKRLLQLLEAQGLEDEWARAQRRRLSALLFT